MKLIGATRALGSFHAGLHEDRKTPVTEFLRGRMNGAFGVLNDQLARQRFAEGERPTNADVSTCGYLYFADEFGISWVDDPNIVHWLGDIRAFPGWVHPSELMPAIRCRRRNNTRQSVAAAMLAVTVH